MGRESGTSDRWVTLAFPSVLWPQDSHLCDVTTDRWVTLGILLLCGLGAVNCDLR